VHGQADHHALCVEHGCQCRRLGAHHRRCRSCPTCRRCCSWQASAVVTYAHAGNATVGCADIATTASKDARGGASAANRDHAQVTCTKRAVVQPTTDRVIACASAIADAQADAANRAEVTRVDSASAWTCTRQPLRQGCRRPVSPWCGCLAGRLCHHHHPHARRQQRGCRRRSRLSRRRQLRPSRHLRLRQWRRRRS
jgi:hypothetical protein